MDRIHTVILIRKALKVCQRLTKPSGESETNFTRGITMYVVASLSRATVLSLLLLSLTITNLYAKNEKDITKRCESGIEVTMGFQSDKLVALQPVEIQLKIVNAQGIPVPNALIYCSLYMPNFATGSNNPKLKPHDEDGGYKGVAFFSREGKWHANLTINLPDGTYDDVTLEIDKVLPANTL